MRTILVSSFENGSDPRILAKPFRVVNDVPEVEPVDPVADGRASGKTRGICDESGKEDG